VRITVSISQELLRRVDSRSQELGVGRNDYILKSLEKAVEEETSWSPAFLKMLGVAASDVEGAKPVDEMMTALKNDNSAPKP